MVGQPTAPSPCEKLSPFGSGWKSWADMLTWSFPTRCMLGVPGGVTRCSVHPPTTPSNANIDGASSELV